MFLSSLKHKKIEKCVLYPLKQRLMKGLTNSCLGWFIYPMDTGASTCSDHWCPVVHLYKSENVEPDVH